MSGDNDLDAFCRREWPRLVGALSLYTGDAALAEELAQETIARVCQHWHQVQRHAAPGAWAHRVAVNLAHSHFRRRKVAARIEARLRAADVVEHTGDVATAVALRAAVAQLPHRQRAAVVLRYYLDLSTRDVAMVLRCPDGTVKTLTRRAIATLRAAGLTDEMETYADD